MDDKLTGSIAQVTMRETVNLLQFATLIEERWVLVEDSYKDHIQKFHNDLQTLEKLTKGVKKILKADL